MESHIGKSENFNVRCAILARANYWQSASQATPSLSASLALHPQTFN